MPNFALSVFTIHTDRGDIRCQPAAPPKYAYP